jgi:hypothetical protein
MSSSISSFASSSRPTFSSLFLVPKVARGDADIQDNLAGVDVEINAVLIMQTLFGFELGNYYRLVLLLLPPPPLPRSLS